MAISDYVKWSGNPLDYLLYKQPDGTFKNGGYAEHAEAVRYMSAGLADPQVEKIFAQYATSGKAGMNAEQLAFFNDVAGNLSSVGAGPIRGWGAVDLFDGGGMTDAQAQAILIGPWGSGAQFLSDAQKGQAAAFDSRESASAQAARDSGDGFGDFLKIAAAVAAAYFSVGTSLAAEGVVAETLVAETAVQSTAFDAFAANYFSPSGTALLEAFTPVNNLSALAMEGANLSTLASSVSASTGLTLADAFGYVKTAKDVYSTASAVQKLAGGATTSGLASTAYRGGSVPSGLSGTVPTPAEVTRIAQANAAQAPSPQSQSAFDSQTVLMVGALCIGLFLFWSKKHG
jgi:hypothetical protein